MTTASRSVIVGVEPGDFFKLISDYERYPEILPEIEAAKVLNCQGNRVEARFTINLIKRVEYTLAMVESPPYGLTWSLVEGPFKKNSGSWRLEKGPDGTTSAHYTVDLKVGVFVPKALSSRVVGKALPDLLRHFKNAAESEYGA